jgi:hypothetical protein
VHFACIDRERKTPEDFNVANATLEIFNFEHVADSCSSLGPC